MLITFKSPAASDTTYVGPIGERFLKMMGRSKNVPGAMMAEDVPEALAQFKRELERIEQQERDAIQAARERRSGTTTERNGEKDKEGSERPVPLSNRAYPLIQMLEKAIEAECEVIWE